MVAALLLLAACSASAELVSVRDPRPVSAAVRVLEKRHAVVITYEDPPYLYPGDMADVSYVRRTHTPGEKPVLIPLGGELSLAYELPSSRQPKDLLRVLQSLLNVRPDAPHEFVVLDAGKGVFHVVPSRTKDQRGVFIDVTPQLDAVISFPPGERSMDEAIEEVCAAIGRASGRKVAAIVPNNWGRQQRVSRGANHEKARDVLRALLQEQQRRPPLMASWQLLAGPGDETAVLNVYFVNPP